jgi:hypothetical protein
VLVVAKQNGVDRWCFFDSQCRRTSFRKRYLLFVVTGAGRIKGRICQKPDLADLDQNRGSANVSENWSQFV